MATQWQLDFNGRRRGLRYEAILLVMQSKGVKKRQQPDVFNALQTMEIEALRVWQAAADKD